MQEVIVVKGRKIVWTLDSVGIFAAEVDGDPVRSATLAGLKAALTNAVWSVLVFFHLRRHLEGAQLEG